MNKVINEWSALIASMVVDGASDNGLKAAIIESRKAIDKSKEGKNDDC